MREDSILNSNWRQRLARYLLVNFLATVVLSAAQPTLAQTQQKTFASPEQASQALYDAVWIENDKAVQAILGSPNLTSSDKDNDDKTQREHFVRKYAEMHRLVRESDGSTVLYVGAENWPFPVPLVGSDGQWRFDAESGSQEIIAREIGENESTAIQVCKAMTEVSSQNSYKTSGDEAALLEFAQSLAKFPRDNSAASETFHGYNFQFVKARTGNTFLVAYPAEYGSTGVMTFVLAGSDVYERNLGPQTTTTVQKLHGKPGAKWLHVQ